MKGPVNWDDITTWPPLDEMTVEDQCHVQAWRIRCLMHIDVRIEPGEGGGLRIICAGKFRRPSTHPDDVLEYLEGFLAGCESMADRVHDARNAC